MTWRVRWLIMLLAIILAVTVLAPLLPLANPLQMDMARRLAGPSFDHWLGQDLFGRDVLSRLIWAARPSLMIAGASAAIACILGTALGLIGGFLGKVAESVTLRSMDILLCFPPLLLAMVVITLSKPGAGTLIPVLALVYLPGFARVAHASALVVRKNDYVEAARSLGASPVRIMLRTILPNIGGPLVIQLSLTIAAAIVLESGLSFLGLGVVPPTPSWGLMIGEARATIAQAPLLVVWPCLVLASVIFLFNALCDAARDFLDPKSVVPPARSPVDRILPGYAPSPDDLLVVQGLTVTTMVADKSQELLREVTLKMRRGQTLALVGESGSGKSLTSLAIMGLLPASVRRKAGQIWLDGVSVTTANAEQLRQMRGTIVSMIFQDPATSLNPIYRIGRQIGEAFEAHGGSAGVEAVLPLLQRVGIPDPARRYAAFPHEMSGGMRQRVMIAIAIANKPRLILADEPTTALDVTVQAQILDLLDELKAESGASMLFVSHSLPVVAQIADRVAVMYCGEIVEEGFSSEIFLRPRHPYTRALIDAIPGDNGLPKGIPGTVPPIHARPEGCWFAPRCSYRKPACEAAHPDLERTDSADHEVRCIRWRELCLQV